MQKPHPQAELEWTIIRLLQWTTAYFNSHEIDSPRATAEILLAHALNIRRIDLYLRHDQPLHPDELAAFKVLIKRRIRREPVAYIVGVKEFWSLDFEVSPDVLIPRPETECLVEAAVSILQTDRRKPRRVLELGVGSGAIILSMASQLPDHSYYACDRSTAALQTALRNARRHSLTAAIRWFASDWTASLAAGRACFDLIVSNPPYIPSQAIAGLQPEIAHHEPIGALDGGDDGLASIREILSDAHRFLGQDGWLLLEIGHDQQQQVERIVRTSRHYRLPDFLKDYGGHPRVMRVQKESTHTH